MAKFIIEVSDGYIRERADIQNIQTSVEGKENGFMEGLMNLVIYQEVIKKLDEGVSEFHISSSDDLNEKELKIFNNLITSIAVLTTMRNDFKDIEDKLSK